MLQSTTLFMNDEKVTIAIVSFDNRYITILDVEQITTCNIGENFLNVVH